MMILSTMLYKKAFEMSETMDFVENVFSAIILMLFGIGAAIYNIAKLYFYEKSNYRFAKFKWNALNLIKIKFVILCVLLMSCTSESKMVKDCEAQTLKEVVFPNSKIVYHSNDHGYNYIVSDVNNVKWVSCSCKTTGNAVIDYIKVLEQK